MDAASTYVAISRARTHAAIYTDDRSRLTAAIGVRDGIRIAALDEINEPLARPIVQLKEELYDSL